MYAVLHVQGNIVLQQKQLESFTHTAKCCSTVEFYRYDGDCM